ncbi:YndM family protein [Bacillus songklensis]|uniref:YndM family protein n=1 Tax=Bacillus songklensis TaxID=1069116 RepID=A0ABV8AZX7_9BACI
MMKHVMALIIKFVFIGTVLFSILGIFYNATIVEIFTIVILMTGVSYLVGDLFILPKLGNVAAGIGDFALTFAGVWFLSYFFIETTLNILVASFFAAFAITAIEILFHLFMRNRVLEGSKDKQPLINMRNNRFATEFSEEYSDPEIERKQNNRGKQSDN